MKKRTRLVMAFVILLLTAVTLFLFIPINAKSALTDASTNMGDGIAAAFDQNNNRIADSLDKEIIQKEANGHANDSVSVVVILNDSPSILDTDLFALAGGTVTTELWSCAINGFGGKIAYAKIEDFVVSNPNVKLVEKDATCHACLAYAAQQIGARTYVWNTTRYRGDANSSIAIVDTGIDASQSDFSEGYGDQNFSKKIVGWKDYVNSTATPFDDVDHGTHCAGIAAGDGFFSKDANGNATCVQDIAYDLEAGYIYTFSLGNWCVNGTGGMSVQLLYHCSASDMYVSNFTIWYGNKTLDRSKWVSENTASTSSPDTWYESDLSWTSSGGYDDFHVTLYAFPGANGGRISICEKIRWAFNTPSDGYAAWTGIANQAKLVGVKMLSTMGSGTISEAVSAINWVDANRQTYHITVASMSWGTDGFESASIDSAVQNLVRNGTCVVVAAGNNPSMGNNTIWSPGTCDYCCTVGAINQFDNVTEYSSEGGQSRYWGQTTKPDVVAPGGSFLMAPIFSQDSDNKDCEGTLNDVQANDSRGLIGTSMSTPIVAGAMNILIQALGGYSSWNWTRYCGVLPKMLLCMTATETYPNLRESSNPTYSPTLDRGGKDVHEGYGRINLDAAVDAVTQTYNVGDVVNGTLGRPPTSSDITTLGQHLAWARKVELTSGTTYKFNMTVPSGADFDLYLYNGTGNGYGEPLIVNSSATPGTGGVESIEVTASYTGTYYIVVKRATETTGAGQFTLTSFVKHTEEVTLYPNGDYSVALLTYGGSGTHYSCVNEHTIDNDTSYVYSPTNDNTYEDDFDIDNCTFSREVTIDSATITGWIRSVTWVYPATFRIFYDTGTSRLYSSYEFPGTTYQSITLNVSGLTPSTLNSSRIGVEIAAGCSLHQLVWYAGRCTQMYMMVNYSYWDTS